METTRTVEAELQTGQEWHALAEDAVLEKLGTSRRGLSPDEAQRRLDTYGRNLLPTRDPPTIFQIILHQIASPLIYILIAAGAVAVLLQDYKDAVFIFAVIILNAAIGAFQEWQAEKSAHSLQKLVKTNSRVRRGGESTRVSAEELVPGDIVLLESGERVPADLRLLEARSLAIDESFLTGESIAAEKQVEPLDEQTLVSERSNMAFASSTVTNGRGVGVVIATAMHTEVGKIARTIAEEEGGKAPLVLRMEHFARQIAIIIVAFAVLLGAVLLAQGTVLEEVFFIVVAIAVSAIPEGLPVALTVVLSIATRRMSLRNVIVRRLNTVESLGSCTLIASDKTGTLTVNQQTARQIRLPGGRTFAISGQGYNTDGEVRPENGDEGSLTEHDSETLRQLALTGVLCNSAEIRQSDGEWAHQGDAMDVALLFMSHKLGHSPEDIYASHERLAEIPFNSALRYAATAYRARDDQNGADQQVYLAVKGALEAVLPFCRTMLLDGQPQPLDANQLTDQAEDMAEAGYRVLALAWGETADAPEPDKLEEEHLHDLTLIGLVGFIDPLRAEALKAVTEAQAAGVRVVMITGDHPATALTIARELKIAESEEQVMTGAELAELEGKDIAELAADIKDVRVFARVTPDQKLRIVDAFMTNGEFVAVTGDGVNDAPALRKANIGVAMGSGTDVAKDTASMIVTDDNFASIVGGIEEGRFAYANVRKVTLLLIATGAAELLLLGLSILFQLPLPLLAVQILWLNLVTNGIQDVALAFEAGEGEVMRQRPRDPSEGIFNRAMLQQVVISGLTMGLVCFGFWWIIMASGWDEDSGRNVILGLMVLMQSWHVLNSRSEVRSAFRVPLRNNPILIIGMTIALAVHILATLTPIGQEVLRLEPLAAESWLILAGFASSVLVVMEIYKWFNKRITAALVEAGAVPDR
jgi:Ca2+-transporting ATPase